MWFSETFRDFKIDISSKEIIPIILNSLPFSLDFNINDVIFTDFSIISRFFSTRYINKIMKSKNVVGLEKTYDQWGGKLPKANNFLNYISDPYQIFEIKNQIISYKTEHYILDYKLIFNRYSIEG
jgi:hypothetical protein